MLKKITCPKCQGIFKTEDEYPPLARGQNADLSAPVTTEKYARSRCPYCRPDSPFRVVRVKCDHCGQVIQVQLGQLFSQPRRAGDVPTG